MAKRPILDKQVARLEKALRPGMPTNIDLIAYLMDRRLARTKGEAERMLIAGKVRVESHKVGRIKVFDPLHGDENNERWVCFPFIPSQYRDDIVVDQ